MAQEALHNPRRNPLLAERRGERGPEAVEAEPLPTLVMMVQLVEVPVGNFR